jgi:hypothetical protein
MWTTLRAVMNIASAPLVFERRGRRPCGIHDDLREGAITQLAQTVAPMIDGAGFAATGER